MINRGGQLTSASSTGSNEVVLEETAKLSLCHRSGCAVGDLLARSGTRGQSGSSRNEGQAGRRNRDGTSGGRGEKRGSSGKVMAALEFVVKIPALLPHSFAQTLSALSIPTSSSCETSPVADKALKASLLPVTPRNAPAPISYVHAPSSLLFPLPLQTQKKESEEEVGAGLTNDRAFEPLLKRFRFLGRLLAQGILDERLLDLPLAPPLYKALLGVPLTVHDIVYLDPFLGKTLAKLDSLARQAQCRAEWRKKEDKQGGTGAMLKDQIEAKEDGELDVERWLSASDKQELTLDGCPVEDLGLDFTMPGRQGWIMCDGGAEKTVTLNNAANYVSLVCQNFLAKGVERQITALKQGFSEICSLEALQCFSPLELELLVCGGDGQAMAWDFSPSTLIANTQCSQGYTHNSKAVQFLFEILG